MSFISSSLKHLKKSGEKKRKMKQQVSASEEELEFEQFTAR